MHRDAFYLNSQRNKLIREACTALYGYCRQQSRPVSLDDKKDLSSRLYNLAPKSLGDPGEHPEVIKLVINVELPLPMLIEY